MARTRSVHSQPKQHGSDKEEAETLLDLHKQIIPLYSRIAKRLGVNASYINRVANGEHQSEKLRRALLSELGLMQAAA
jgi:transcriptional regulator with XRE-family HTH domain